MDVPLARVLLPWFALNDLMKRSERNPAECRRNRIRTLLVDSPAMLKILATMITEGGGFEIVGTAMDGYAALLDVASLAPQLVVMDLHLPYMHGPQVARCLKEFENPPVVFITAAENDSASREMSVAAGADAFLPKNGDLRAQLHSKLQEWFTPEAASIGTPADVPLERTRAGRE